MITLDPDMGESSPEILRKVAEAHNGTAAPTAPSWWRAHTTAGCSGAPLHVGPRFSQPSSVTATVSSCRMPSSP